MYIEWCIMRFAHGKYDSISVRRKFPSPGKNGGQTESSVAEQKDFLFLSLRFLFDQLFSVQPQPCFRTIECSCESFR